MTRLRLDPEVRKENIIQSALAVSRKDGLTRVTRKTVAEHAGIAEGLVSHYYNTMNQLRRDVARRAMADEDPVLLSMMLSDPKLKKRLDPRHKEIAINHLQG
jgi:DNA-binding transcriptional regulator YbjK